MALPLVSKVNRRPDGEESFIVNEEHVIGEDDPNFVWLREVPLESLADPIVLAGLTEVDATPGVNEFRVHYTGFRAGAIEFHPSKNALPVTIPLYRGRGSTVVAADLNRIHAAVAELEQHGIVNVSEDQTVTGQKTFTEKTVFQPADGVGLELRPAQITGTPRGSFEWVSQAFRYGVPAPHPDIDNQILSLIYNRGGTDPDYPVWSDNLEVRFVKDGPPYGLLELHWNYEGLPGRGTPPEVRTTFRPWSYNMDLGDHHGITWTVAKYFAISRVSVDPLTGVATRDDAYAFTTQPGSATGGAAVFKRPLSLRVNGIVLEATDSGRTQRFITSVAATASGDPYNAIVLRAESYTAATNMWTADIGMEMYGHSLFLRRKAVGASAGLLIQGGTDNLGFRTKPGTFVLQAARAGSGGVPANWLTDSVILATNALGLGNTVAATTPGPVTRKAPVYDMNGTLLGYMALYSTIT